MDDGLVDGSDSSWGHDQHTKQQQYCKVSLHHMQ